MWNSPPRRIVLFAQARSGSTSLCRILQLHPLINFVVEPFWHGFTKANPGQRNYVDHITDVPSLEWALDELFATHNGIKILAYQLPEEVYTHLLLMPDIAVIFLRRRNLLQVEVSGKIAKQTGVWQNYDMTDDARRAYQQLQPVSLGDIEEGLDCCRHLRDYYTSVIGQRQDGSYIRVFYEELSTGEAGASREAMRRIFEYLGLDTPDSPEVDSILDPNISKLNTPESYATLPNAHAINDRFGNDDTGWLFDPKNG